MPKLKVYRTAIGFHDAYVAAPSMKAALAAWGADANLFARGQAEIVTDEALAAEPLARPGEVIKRARGTDAEHLAALGPPPTRGARQPVPRASPTAKQPKPKPRPSRAALDAADAALGAAEQRQAEERAAIAEREAALREERRSLEADQRAESMRLESARREADLNYSEAMRRWREAQ